jgi:N-glycosylase/DNA lyase
MAQNTLSAQSAERPIYLFDVSKIIRSFGQIWMIDKFDFGTVFRVTVNKVSCRVVIPSPFEINQKVPIPEERNSRLFVVTNTDDLATWLENLKAS